MQDESAKQYFLEAAYSEVLLAEELENLESSDSIDHWISAISCFLECDKENIGLQIINDLTLKF